MCDICTDAFKPRCQECVAKSAFWVTKKRYGQWIINDGGIVCDRLDVKGLDIVRSSFPPAMRKLMTGVLQDILGNVDKVITLSIPT